MSQIDKLIADLCPDGVEFKRISDVSSKGSKIKWGQVGNAEYQYIDLGAVEPRTRQIGKTQTINSCNAPSRAQQIVHSGDIIFATTRPTQLRWALIPDSYDGQVVSTGYCVIRPDRSSIITNYLAHTLGTTTFLKYLKANQILGNYPSIPDSRIQEFRIPVPPLEVQREIVRVLDKFTQLEAELEAELEARHRQYEHYRAILLSFGNKIEWTTLGNIATIGTGSHDTKNAVPDGEYVFYARGREPLRLDSFDFDENAIITAGDGVGVGKVFHFATGKYALHQRAYRIAPHKGVDARYVYHYLVSDFSNYLKQTSVHASVTSLRRPMFIKYPIPLPPLEEQRRIVSVLDKFDSLVNDLSIGLPAELAARRKQYEYYRDRLLTFEEKR